MNTTHLTDQDIERALRALDHAMPATHVQTVIAAARARAAAAASGRVPWRSATVSSALTVGAVALAAALMPGRVHDAIGHLSMHQGKMQTAVAHVPLAARGGVSFVPTGSAEVDFQVAQAGGAVRIIVGTGQALTVRGPAQGPRYRVSANRVVVSNIATAQDDYEVEIPAAPTAVLVRVGPRVVLATGEGRMITAARRDAEGRYVVPLGTGAVSSDSG